MAKAILSLVPTPSALETRSGSRQRLRSRAKRAPNAPMPPTTPRVNVRAARRAIFCLAWSARAMFTPASAYFMRMASRRFLAKVGGSKIRPYERILEKMKESFPADAAGMDEHRGIGLEALGQVAGLPRLRARLTGVFGRVNGKINHHRHAHQIVARDESPIAAVVGIGAIIPHYKITFGRDMIGAPAFIRIHGLFYVGFHQALAVDPHRAIVNLHRVPGHADHAFD